MVRGGMNSQLSPATYPRGALADLAELQRTSVGRARWQSIWGASAAALRSINRHAAALAGGGPTQNAEQQQQRPREHRARRSQRRAARDDPDPESEPPLEAVPLARFRRDVRRWLEVARP
jgi:hypothetical protein